MADQLEMQNAPEIQSVPETTPVVTEPTTPVNAFAAEEIVPMGAAPSTPKIASDDTETEYSAAAPLKQTQEPVPDDKPVAKNQDFLSKEDDPNEKATASDTLQKSDYYWNDPDIRLKFETKYPGQGKEKYEEYYKQIEDKYFNKVADETDNLIMGDTSMGAKYRKGMPVQLDMSIKRQVGGGGSFSGKSVGQRSSVRQADLDSKNLVDDQGNITKVTDEWSDVIGNDKYAKNGKKIIALEYIPYAPGDIAEGGVKPIYEGERSTGEIVSIHDMNGWITSNNDLTTASGLIIPKAIARSTINTVTSLAGGFVDLLNSTAVLLDSDNDNAFIRSTNDITNKFKAYGMTTADYDQQHMMTAANATNMITDVAAQLILAGGIGRIAGGLTKLATSGTKLLEAGLTATEAAAKLQATMGGASSLATITALSLMGASGVKDEAIKAGFSEDAAAGLFLAYLPAMAAANKISSVIINSESAPFIKAQLEKTAREGLALATPEQLATPASRWAFSKIIANKSAGALAKLSEVMSQGKAGLAADLAWSSAGEATEEVVEQLLGDALKTGANVISKYSTNGDDYPKMLGMYDKEYWEQAPSNLLMNAVGGAIGGPMGRLVFRHGGSQSLPFQTGDQDKIMRLTLAGGENLKLYKESLAAARDKGQLGTDKFSYKMNADGKFQRLEDLDPKEKGNHLSIAEANYRLKMMQVNFYESVLGGYNGNYDKLMKDHPDMGKLMTDRNAGYQAAVDTYTELEGMYKQIAPEMYEAGEKEKRNWFGKPKTVTAAADAAAASAKTTAKTNADHVEVTTNEKTDTSKPLQVDNEVYTTEIQEYAKKLGQTPEFAKRMMDKEQELEDILTGKTMERDYIDMIVASDPKTFGILSSERDPSLRNVDGSLLDAITIADIDRFNTQQRDHANYLTKKQEYESMVDSMETTDDIVNLAKLVQESGNPFYVSPEKRAVLKSKIRSIVSEGTTVNGVTTGGYSDADVKGLYDWVEQEYAVTANVDDTRTDLEAPESLDELSNIEQIEVSTVERADAVNTFVDANIDKLYQYSKSSAIKEAMGKGKIGAYDILTAKVPTKEEFKEGLKSFWTNDDTQGEEELGGLTLLTAAQTLYNTLAQDSKNELIPVDNKLKAETNKHAEASALLDVSASESSVDNPGTFIEMFFKTFSPSGTSVVTNSNDLLDEINKLNGRKSDDGLFDAKEEATALLSIVKARRAQLELIYRLGDPMNQIPTIDTEGKESYAAKGAAIGNVLSTLRKYNAKILSPEEFNASIKDTKYSKYSKFVSGWILDPVKFNDLLSKENKSVEETMQVTEMDNVLKTVQAGIMLLNESESNLNELIQLGNESQNELQVAEKFKGSIKTYIGKGDASFATRLSDLTDNIEDDDLQKKILSLTTKAASASNADDAQITALYNDFIDVARSLFAASPDTKKAILNKIATKDSMTRNMDIIAFLNASIDEFHTNFKKVIDTVESGDKAVIMPTMEQEIVAFEVFSFATVPTNTNIIKQKIKSFGNYKAGENNIIFVPGSYGTGKTQVVMGYATKAAQLYMQTKFPVDNGNSTMICANNTDQVNKLQEAVNTFDINTIGNGESYGFTKEDLHDLFKDPAIALKKLEKVSLIVFDEATLIDRYDSGTTKSLFTMISEGIDYINNERAKDSNLPMLSFIGLGDEKQGGFRSGDTDSKGNVIGEPGQEGTVLNISDNHASIVRTKELTTNFRAFVTVIDSFAKAVKDISSFGISRNLSKTTSKVRTHYGPIIDDATEKIGGVQIVNTRGTLYEGLAEELTKQLEADPTFNVLIVDETIGSAQDLPYPELQALAAKYPSAFKFENFKDDSQLKFRTINGAQGMEASYVIINIPEDGWLPQVNNPDTRSAYRYNMLSMLAGRARYFAKIRLDATTDITSAEAQTPIFSIKHSTTQFMGTWSEFRKGLLGVVGKTTVPSSVTEKLKPAIAYEEGEVVALHNADGSFDRQVKIVSITDEGDIMIAEVDDTEGNAVVDSGLNVHTTSNLDILLRRGKSEAPATFVESTIPPVLPVVVLDERAQAYRDAKLRKGTEVIYNGKKIKLDSSTQLTDGDKVVKIDRDKDLGTTIKIQRIEDILAGETKKAIKKEEKKLTEKPVAPKPLQDPVNKPEDTFNADAILTDIKGFLNMDEFDFDQIQDYIDQLTSSINNGKFKDKKDLKKAVNMLSDLEGLLHQDEDDFEYTPEQEEVVNNLVSEDFSMEGDKTGKVEAMVELEKKGVVVGYVEIAKENGAETYDHSMVSKWWNSRDNFWNGSPGTHIASATELEELTRKASGMTKTPEKDMMGFEYSFATYQYMQGEAVQYGHAIVATESSTGKKFILTHLPTANLEEGKFKTFVRGREDVLKGVADAYMKATKDGNPVGYSFDADNAANHGSIFNQATGMLNKRDSTKSIRSFNKGNRQLPITMETRITNDFLSGNKILLGSTPGTLMRSSNAIMGVMSEISDPSWSNEHISELANARKELSVNALVDKFTTGTTGKKITDADSNAVKDSKLFTLFGGKHLVAKFGPYSIVMVKITPNTSIPYFTTDGREFSPFFGFTEDGKPIQDKVSEDSEVLYTEVNQIKKALESMTLDAKMGSAKVYDEKSFNILRSNISSVLGYSLPDIDGAASGLETVRIAGKAIRDITAKTFENVPVTFRELKALTSHVSPDTSDNAHKRNNNRKDLSFSTPMVFKQDVPGKKGAKTAGKIFVLYSSNGKYDLTDPAVVAGLETKIKEYAIKAKDDSLEGAVASLRDGIGVLMLDYPHSSFSELAKIYKNTPKEEFNRYAIPSNSQVNKRLIAFFTDISTAIKDVNRRDPGNSAIGRDKTQYSRIKELREANTDEKGRPVRVLDDNLMAQFVTDLVAKYNVNDPVITHFLSIIDTMTKDANMGNYKAELSSESITDETPQVEMERYHAYPSTNLDGKKFSLVVSERSGKPVVLNINKRPLVFIPKSVATKAGSTAEYQPMKLNMESFFELALKHADPAVVEATLKIFDTLMLDHTIKGTLNLGIKVPPAMTKMGKTASWGTFSGDIDLDSKLTTPVKDIRSSALAFNIDNLIQSVEDAKVKPVETKSVAGDVAKNATVQLDSIVDNLEADIANNPNPTDAFLKQKRTQAEKAANTIVADATKTAKGKILTAIKAKYEEVISRINGLINRHSVPKTYTFEELREGKFQKPNDEIIAKIKEENPTFDAEHFTAVLDGLASSVDQKHLKESIEELKAIADSVKPKKILNKYIDPIVAAYTKGSNMIGSSNDIKNIVAAYDAGKITIPTPAISTENTINALHKFLNPDVLNPHNKTELLRAYVRGDADQKAELEPFLFSDKSNLNKPAITAYAIYDALVSYPVPLDSKPIMELKAANPDLYNNLMSNPNVQEAIASLTFSTQTAEEWVNNFNDDINFIVSQQLDTTTKTKALNALQITLSGWQSVFPGNMYNEMEQKFNEARKAIDNADDLGTGFNLTASVTSLKAFTDLPADLKVEYVKILNKVQKDVGKNLDAISSILKGEKKHAEVSDKFSDEAALIASAAQAHSGTHFEGFMDVMESLFSSMC